MEKKITFTDDVLNISNEKLEKIFENSGNVIPADWSKYITTNKRNARQRKNGTLEEIKIDKESIIQIAEEIKKGDKWCKNEVSRLWKRMF